MIHIIAAVAKNKVIGKDNRIPWDIPADLDHFKALTMGHTVIMGRRTFESIGHVLPNRENIIVSNTMHTLHGAVVMHSLQEALKAASNEEIFVIGGAGLYREALPLAEYLHITQVDLLPEGDTYFPEIDYTLYDIAAYREYDGTADGMPDCAFVTYRRKR